MSGVLRNLGWLLAGKGVGAVLSIVYLGLAARTLTPADFGEFTIVVSTGQAVASFVGFQAWQIVVRYGMPHLAAGRQAALARVVAYCIMLDISAALAGCALSWALVVGLSRYLGWSPALSRDALVFCLVVLLTPRSSAVGVFRLQDRFDLGAAAGAVTPIARFAGAVLAVAAGPSVQGFLMAWAAAELVTAGAHWLLVWRVAKDLLRQASLQGAWQAPRDNPGLWQFTWLTNAAGTLNAAGKQFAVLLVGVATGPVAAGNYRLAYQLSQSLVRVSEMWARAAFAEFARAHAGLTAASLSALFRRMTQLAAVAGLAACAILLLGRPMLVLIAGRGHEGAYRLLQLLGVAAAIDLAGVAFEPVLVALGRARQALVLRIVATLCLIMALVLLLPARGAVGVAEAALFASACAALLFALASFRALRTLDEP